MWRKPTIINNVETLAQVGRILRDGPDAYRSIGTAGSPGTKTFALTGHVANTGLIEVPFGATLREVVLNIGGGITNDKGKIDKNGFKAVQIGGPSGGCLTKERLDLPLDFDSLRSVRAMVGSGGLVAMNQRTCMVSVARLSCISPHYAVAINPSKREATTNFPEARSNGLHFNDEGTVLQTERYFVNGKATFHSESQKTPELAEW